MTKRLVVPFMCVRAVTTAILPHAHPAPIAIKPMAATVGELFGEEGIWSAMTVPMAEKQEIRM